MKTEEKLTIHWLNERSRFDEWAKNATLRDSAMALLTEINSPILADLGSGTGNNALALLNVLKQNCELHLIEQHGYLLQESKRRLANVDSQPATRAITQKLRYTQGDLHAWVQAMPGIDLLCNSALLDLFTEAELKALINVIAAQKIPLYSTLNYSAIQFDPQSAQDDYYIKQFEQHMCRQLDRGHPLGPAVHTVLLEAVQNIPSLAIEFADSPWIINAEESRFLQMNLEFYQRGISASLNAVGCSADEFARFNNWIEEKKLLLKQRKLSLSVHHFDYLITPLKP